MAVFPSTVIEIFPVVALAGTTTVIDAPVTFETTEVIPLNFTMFASPVALKLEPIIVTLEPTIPDMGEKLLTVGRQKSVLVVEDLELRHFVLNKKK